MWRLCVGCGACASLCPEKKVSLMDVVSDGMRPVIPGENCEGCKDCLLVCPGLEAPLRQVESGPWGPIIQIWEGYSADEELRFRGSSGGVASALTLFALQGALAGGVIHIAADQNEPWKNKTVLSKTHSELLQRTGSRYSPASPCDSLHLALESSEKTIFIGKPCDIQALRKAQALWPDLKEKIYLAISIFCAGTPSTRGLLELFRKLGLKAQDVGELRFRGDGWPGRFRITLKGEREPKVSLSYKESWGMLQAYRPFRCHLCPDGTGEFADISCGDPWYREVGNEEKGYSLVLVRTKRGKEVLQNGIEAGYFNLKRVGEDLLMRSQPELLRKKGSVWGRIFALRAMGIPAPRYPGWALNRYWLTLPASVKARSLFGTWRRAIVRGYWRKKKET